MDDFFQFKNKAFISATPLLPSDPRFSKHGFKYIKLEPKYVYQKDIEVIVSNSTVLSVKKYIAKHKSEHYCFFLNSTDAIASLVDVMGIASQSTIFCSKESVYKLKINKVQNVYDSLQPLSKYNFFTSRFYSAVDIKLDVKPTVIMITDLGAALHTMLDPFTECVQIIGRFRNGVDKIAHIATISGSLTAMNREEAINYLSGCEATYNDFRKLLNVATNPGAKATLEEAMNRVQYAGFLKEDGSKNYFMMDNFLDEERVKGYYISADALCQAYNDSTYFNVVFTNDNFPADERLFNRLNHVVSQNLVFKNVVQGLIKISDATLPYKAEDRIIVWNELQRKFPVIVEAYTALGAERIAESGYNAHQIKREMYKLRSEQDKSHFKLLNRLQNEFEVGKSYSANLIKQRLTEAIREYGLSLKAEIKLLKEYFDLSERTTICRDAGKKDVKGYKIIKSKLGPYKLN